MTRCPTCGCATIGTGDPSPAEARVLDFVLEFHERHGRFPGYKAIQHELRFRSTATVYHHLHGLKTKGLVSIAKHHGITAARRVA